MGASPLQLSHRIVRVRHEEPLRIGSGPIDEVALVEVAVSSGDTVGYGEGSLYPPYGETPETAATFLDDAAGLIGTDPFAFDDTAARLSALDAEMAARAALDGALHDLCGKLVGLPVWRLLGVGRTGPPTTLTLGVRDPDDLARGAIAAAARGFRRLKLKLGAGDGLDLERVRAVHHVVTLPLVVDVNGCWSLAEAREILPQLASCGVEYVEQPLAPDDPGESDLRRSSSLPIYVDESCHTLADLRACVDVAHGVNIKLAKCGGIREALRMVHAARALGLGVMIGCMSESSLGIAAGCVIAGSSDFVDLDTNLLLANDPWAGMTLSAGVQVPSDRPGFGLERTRASADP